MAFLIGLMLIPAICGLIVIVDNMIEFVRYYTFTLKLYYSKKQTKKLERATIKASPVVEEPKKVEVKTEEVKPTTQMIDVNKIMEA